MTRSTRLVCAAVTAASLGLGFAAGGRGPAAALAADAAGPKAAGTFEVYKDKGGEFRWRLKSSNGKVIATSGDGYKEKRDCLAGIESVRKNAAAAKVTDEPAAP